MSRHFSKQMPCMPELLFNSTHRHGRDGGLEHPGLAALQLITRLRSLSFRSRHEPVWKRFVNAGLLATRAFTVMYSGGVFASEAAHPTSLDTNSRGAPVDRRPGSRPPRNSFPTVPGRAKEADTSQCDSQLVAARRPNGQRSNVGDLPVAVCGGGRRHMALQSTREGEKLSERIACSP